MSRIPGPPRLEAEGRTIAYGVLLNGVCDWNGCEDAFSQFGRTVPLSFKLNATLVLLGVTSQGGGALGLLPFHTYLVALSFFLYCAGFGFVRLFVSLRPQ